MRYSDEFWEEAFETYSIKEHIEIHGYFEITNENIKNDFSKRFEPRLVTKFDTINSLPNIFKSEDKKEVLYSILPYKKSGTYCIVPHNVYEILDVDFKLGMKINKLSIPSFIISVDKTNITSESNAINMGIISGIFEHFLEDGNLYSTVSGRMRSGDWAFKINNEEDYSNNLYSVNSTQMEIDGSLESETLFALIEAKNKLNNDFLIRQLYYPYRDFYEKFGYKKNIRNIFMIYNAGIYILLEYEFLEVDNIQSIKLVKKEYYTLGEWLAKDDVKNILQKSTFKEKETSVFPQANDLFKILNSLELFADDVDEEYLTSNMVKEYYQFDKRQGNYYKQALCFLGLIDGNIKSKITPLGEKYLKSNFENKIKIIIQSLAEHDGIRKIMWDILIFDKTFKKEDYLNTFEGADSTVKRRLDTINAWVKWLKIVIE